MEKHASEKHKQIKYISLIMDDKSIAAKSG